VGTLCLLGASPMPAAGCHRDLAQRFHHDDLYGGPALLLLEAHLGNYRSLPTRDITRRHPVEGERQDIVPAELAGAEGRKMRPQGVVGGHDVIFYQIPDHSTASAGVTTDPMNVEPVVPVRRTS
jgi:hypothetical protein